MNEINIKNIGPVKRLKLDVSEPGLYVLKGKNGCLHGSTIIFDPTDRTKVSVEERHRIGKQFHTISLTNDGPVITKAMPPWKFKATPMIEFKLQNGETITVTHEHRFWGGENYVSAHTILRELQLFGVCHLPTISDNDLLAHLQDAFRLTRKPEDFQDDYPAYLHSCDEQLLSDQESFQEHLPSQACAHEQSLDCFYADDLAVESKHIHHYPVFAHYLHQPRSDYEHQSLQIFCKEHQQPKAVDAPSDGYTQKSSQPHAESSRYDKAQSRFLPLRHSMSSSLLCTQVLDGACDLLTTEELQASRQSATDEDRYCINREQVVVSQSFCLQCNSRNEWTTNYMLSSTVVSAREIDPVSYYDFHVPVYENYWAQGCFHHNSGKTSVLNAINKAITGKGDSVSVTDDEDRGSVDGFGIRMSVGKSTRTSGELEVTSLEGRFSLSELVDPGLKDQLAADAKRIKALVQISGVPADCVLFHELCASPDEFNDLTSPGICDTDDLVVMADRVKRDLDAAARKVENHAEQQEGVARGAREASAGIDMTAESDPEALQKELEDCIRAESEVQARVKTHADAQKTLVDARERLEGLKQRLTGPTMLELKTSGSEAKAAWAAAEELKSKIAMEIETLKTKLTETEKEAVANKNRYESDLAAYKARDTQEKLLLELKNQQEIGVPEPPDEQEILVAHAVVTKAREAVEQGALIRKAKETGLASQKAAEEATQLRKKAERLREAAKGTDDVLSQAVCKSGSPLRVERGRLVLDTKRGKTFFSELSEGERWRIALDIAIDAVGEKGVIVLPQESYESLDPINRKSIAEHVRERKAVVLTAECSEDEEITTEVL